MSDLVKRAKDWRIGVLGGVDSKGFEIAGELIDRIEQLERELVAEKSYTKDLQTSLEEFARKLAAEKALTDQLYRAFNAVNNAIGGCHSNACAAYRKARGL